MVLGQGRCLYAILGVHTQATTDEIRHAYLRKALQLHPDRGGDASLFVEADHAYRVLSNAETRHIYDLSVDDLPEGDNLFCSPLLRLPVDYRTLGALVEQDLAKWATECVDKGLHPLPPGSPHLELERARHEVLSRVPLDLYDVWEEQAEDGPVLVPEASRVCALYKTVTGHYERMDALAIVRIVLDDPRAGVEAARALLRAPDINIDALPPGMASVLRCTRAAIHFVGDRDVLRATHEAVDALLAYPGRPILEALSALFLHASIHAQVISQLLREAVALADPPQGLYIQPQLLRADMRQPRGLNVLYAHSLMPTQQLVTLRKVELEILRQHQVGKSQGLAYVHLADAVEIPVSRAWCWARAAQEFARPLDEEREAPTPPEAYALGRAVYLAVVCCRIAMLRGVSPALEFSVSRMLVAALTQAIHARHRFDKLDTVMCAALSEVVQHMVKLAQVCPVVLAGDALLGIDAMSCSLKLKKLQRTMLDMAVRSRVLQTPTHVHSLRWVAGGPGQACACGVVQLAYVGSYHCDECDFNACYRCCVVEQPYHVAAIDSRILVPHLVDYYRFTGLLTWMQGVKKGEDPGMREEELWQARTQAMMSLAHDKGITMADIAAAMAWEGVPRDPHGFLPEAHRTVEVEGEAFVDVHGIVIDYVEGTVTLLLRAAAEGESGLYGWRMIQEVLQKLIIGAQFSLDPVDASMHLHPYQQVHIKPATLAGTVCMKALQEADVRVKELTMNTHISSQPPFNLKSASNLYAGLPGPLRARATQLVRDMEQVWRGPQTAHRLWLDAGAIAYDVHLSEGRKTVMIGDPEWAVKAKRREADSSGELHDAPTADDEPEVRWAAFLTDHYEEFGRCFPELLVPRQLAKLSAIMELLVDEPLRYRLLKEQAHRHASVSTDALRRVDYPRNTHAKVEAHLEETIRANGLQDVPRNMISKLDEVRQKIQQKRAEADANDEEAVFTSLAETYYLGTRTRPLHRDFLAVLRGNLSVPALEAVLHRALEQRYSRVLSVLDTMGVPTDIQPEAWAMVDGPWIPSAYRSGRRTIYGGVNLAVNLQRFTSGSGLATPPPPPPPAGGGSGGGAGGNGGGGDDGDGRPPRPTLRLVVDPAEFQRNPWWHIFREFTGHLNLESDEQKLTAQSIFNRTVQHGTAWVPATNPRFDQRAYDAGCRYFTRTRLNRYEFWVQTRGDSIVNAGVNLMEGWEEFEAFGRKFSYGNEK